ncbi:MAG: GAF domain-containing protein, partial [Verrucomicrobiota bacterium]
ENCIQDSPLILYQFLHDRVQQAAYLLIPEQQKKITHYQTGKLLLQHTPPTKWEEKVFDIVNQLNEGITLIETEVERIKLAELNLIAGKKALAATAYAAAAKYLDFSIKCLNNADWESHYSLILSVHETAIKAEYLNINFSHAQKLAKFVLEQTKGVLDRVRICELQIQMYMAQAEMPQALAVGISALKILDVNLNYAPKASDVQLPKLSDIESLPIMQDVHQIAVMRILMAILAPAYTTRPELLSPIVLTMIDRSLRQGHTSLTAFSYVFYGLSLCGFEKDLEKGYYCGLLALKVLDRFSARELECRVKNLFSVFIKPWKEPLSDSIEPLREAREVGFEMGDIEYASYATAHRCTYLFLAGRSLIDLQEEQHIAMVILQRIKQEHSLGHAKIWQQLVSNLVQDVAEPQKLSGNYFDEVEMLPTLCAGNDRSLPFTVYLAKCIISYLLGDYSCAVASAVNADPYSDVAIGITAVTYNFYYSLALLSSCSDLSVLENSHTLTVDNKYTALLERVESNQKLMKEWTLLAPENCEHKYRLVAAENHRVLGRKVEALELYDRAISGAKENRYLQEEALANELAAKFYLDWGKEKVAAGYMQEAYYCYSRWGAKAKVTDLETRYPELLHPILQSSASSEDVLNTLMTLTAPTTSIHTSTHHSSKGTGLNQALDFASILKASQALSSTIQLDELLRELTQIILQNSGGDRCALILPDESGEWQVRAIATPEETHLYAEPLTDNSNVPVKLIQYVKNTQEAIVIDDLKTELPVIDDYLRQHEPKSVLCLPLLNQGHLTGILHLKNQLTSAVFTKDRLLVLNFLCTQAAISLENARLYQKSQHYAKQLEQSQL